MKKKKVTGITVYHGSRSGGIIDLEANQPPEGGIGYGIYVTDDLETAKFYGDIVYELKLMIDPDKDILYVGYEFDNADAVPGTEGESVLIGEHVEPFSFWIKGHRYTVGFDNTPDVAESEYIKEHVFDIDFPDPIYDGLNKYFNVLRRHGDTANLEDFVDDLAEYVELEEMNKLYPDRNFIDNEEDYKLLQERIGILLEPITDKAREIVKKYIGLVIDLMDIGNEARFHGFKAVKMEGVRGGFPDTEILVFDPNDLVMVGEVDEIQMRNSEMKKNKNTVEALLIVHLSSLDACTGTFGEEAGWDLAENISEAIENHEGAVIVIDQKWDLIGRHSKPRQEVYDVIEARGDVIIIEHDEDKHGWEKIGPVLIKKIKKLGVTSVRLGGFWYDPDENSGCAWYIGNLLKDIVEVYPDASILGSYSLLEEFEGKKW